MTSRDLSTYKATSVIRVGSRKSQLALLQTHDVIAKLKLCHSDIDFEIVTYSTKGDEVLGTSLSKIGEKSLFTKELDEALLRNEVDFVVHSLKDVSSHLPLGLTLGAITEREWPGDVVLMSPKFTDLKLETLPAGSIVGTSSLRRTALVARHFPHLSAESVRGNLNTRMAKLEDPNGCFAAIILANCGIKRMGMLHKVHQTLPPATWPPAVGQGSLAVECRASDTYTLQLLSSVRNSDAIFMAIAERAFMASLEGGCSVPIGAHCVRTHAKDQFNMQGFVYSTGPEKLCLTSERFCDTSARHMDSSDSTGYSGIYVPFEDGAKARHAKLLGECVAEDLICQGAKDVLRAEREKNAVKT
ncbi:unnamed protein product [Notodromas monacha]|uniref:hydroxymethylbilane synthase n=1 Tax=Notodromas monacha TaxID=399045 RepID=A0A7R9BJG3_9CRUS|nr:unnamed protein product [Notodromas monacha]CAG0915275.1 unnamed protein product [Notodromas monacha]